MYASTENRREWIHALDHCAAIDAVLERGRVGETYHVGTGVEKSIEEIADAVLAELGKPAELKTIIPDRPGHDRRYVLDWSKIRRELGWEPRIPFDRGLAETVQWYAQNRDWWEPLRERAPVVEGVCLEMTRVAADTRSRHRRRRPDRARGRRRVHRRRGDRRRSRHPRRRRPRRRPPGDHVDGARRRRARRRVDGGRRLRGRSRPGVPGERARDPLRRRGRPPRRSAGSATCRPTTSSTARSRSRTSSGTRPTPSRCTGGRSSAASGRSTTGAPRSCARRGCAGCTAATW